MKKLGGVTLGFTLLLLGVPAYASLLTVCGSTELPGQNFVAFVCGAGANMMSGTATETIVDNTLDDIHISPAVVTGTSLLACGGSCIGGNTHPNFFGSGVLIATFIGVLDNPGLAPPRSRSAERSMMRWRMRTISPEIMPSCFGLGRPGRRSPNPYLIPPQVSTHRTGFTTTAQCCPFPSPGTCRPAK